MSLAQRIKHPDVSNRLSQLPPYLSLAENHTPEAPADTLDYEALRQGFEEQTDYPILKLVSFKDVPKPEMISDRLAITISDFYKTAPRSYLDTVSEVGSQYATVLPGRVSHEVVFQYRELEQFIAKHVAAFSGHSITWESPPGWISPFRIDLSAGQILMVDVDAAPVPIDLPSQVAGIELSQDVARFCIANSILEYLERTIALAKQYFAVNGQFAIGVRHDPDDGEEYVLLQAPVSGNVEENCEAHDAFLERCIDEIPWEKAYMIRFIYQL